MKMNIEEMKKEKDKIIEKYEQTTKEEFRDIKLYTFEDLKNIESAKQEWIVENLIPEGSVVLLAGKRASFKTWVVLELIKSISLGQAFLEKFQTKKVGAWIIDEENGIQTLKERLFKLVDENTKLDGVYFTSFEGIKLDRRDWFEKVKQKLNEHPEIKLLVIDSFRRVSGIEENDAGEISEFLTTKLRPLSLEYGLTIILIHHLRKSLGRNPTDEMDEIRGSSDLANYSDVVIILERPKGSRNRVILKQVKSRRSPELEPLLIDIDWSDNKVKFTCQGSALEYLNDVERCKHQILVWIEENNITTFQRKEAIEVMKSYNFSSKTTQRALTELIAQGKLLKLKKGVYAKPETLASYINNEEGVGDKTEFGTEGTSIYNTSVPLSHPKIDTEDKGKGQRDNKVLVPSVSLSHPETKEERMGQRDKTYNISVPSVPSSQTHSKLTDKSKKQQITDKSTDKSEDVSYWQKLERDIIDTIKNPPIGKCVHDFEVTNFVKQRAYVKHESDVVKVLEKLLRNGIVIRTPDGSLDINWSKWHGGG
jgi:hypothetical protein